MLRAEEVLLCGFEWRLAVIGIPVFLEIISARSSATLTKSSFNTRGSYSIYFALIKLKADGVGEMLLFPIRHAVPEQGGLTEMVVEACTSFPDFMAIHDFSL